MNRYSRREVVKRVEEGNDSFFIANISMEVKVRVGFLIQSPT